MRPYRNPIGQRRSPIGVRSTGYTDDRSRIAASTFSLFFIALREQYRLGSRQCSRQFRHLPRKRPHFLAEFLNRPLGECLGLFEFLDPFFRAHRAGSYGSGYPLADMRYLVSACLTFFASSTVLAGDEPAATTLTLPDVARTWNQRQPIEEKPAAAPPAAAKFGDKGSEWWTLGGGVANNFAKATDYNIRAAWSRFIVKDVEFSLELNAWYFDQPGDKAFGINPAFVFRWHIVNRDTWSFYTDLGIGTLFTTDVVPEGGTCFDFTPRAGLGFTRLLDDQGDRLQLGARWHHISNARIQGDSGNPSRDGVMFYAAIVFPF